MNGGMAEWFKALDLKSSMGESSSGVRIPLPPLMIIASVIVWGSSLASATPLKPLPNDLNISLERTSCFGSCPVYKVSISNDGTVIFDGQSYVNKIGITKSSITIEAVQGLYNDFEKHDVFNLNGRFDEMEDYGDAPFAITSIRANGRLKTIKRYTLPKTPAQTWLIELEKKIDEVSGANRWTDPAMALQDADFIIAHSTDPAQLAEALFNSGAQLYRQQRYLDAIARWNQLIERYPNSPYRKKAYSRIGQVQSGLGHYGDAIKTYESLAANYPNTSEAQEARYQTIMAFYNQNDLKSAYMQYAVFNNSYPTDSRIVTLCQLILDGYNKALGGNDSKSVEITEGLRTCQGGNRTALDILWERGTALFNKKDYSAAQKYFQRIMLTFPTSDDREASAYFFNAQCYSLLNLPAQAASAYKSFYTNYPKANEAPEARAQEILNLVKVESCAEASKALDNLNSSPTKSVSLKDAQKAVASCNVRGRGVAPIQQN
jgi:TolA-binding protein